MIKKKECKVIGFVNQKGGVAKTTSADIFSYILANEKRKKVCLIDFDGQGNSTRSMGLLKELNKDMTENDAPILLDDIQDTISDIMNRIIETGEVLDKENYVRKLKGVDVIPANCELSMLENNLVNVFIDREKILKKFIDTLRSDYDYIVIDALPKLGLQMINVLFACDEIIIPTNCSRKSIDGFHDLFKTINLVKKGGHNLKVAGLLITMANEGTSAYELLYDEIKNNFNEYYLFKSVISYCKKFEESDIVGQLWVERAPKHKTSQRYKEFVDEYLKLKK